MADLARTAGCSACAAVISIHSSYGLTVCIIDEVESPCHESLAKPTITDLSDAAAEYRPSTSPSQAAATADIGPGPGPEHIRSS